MLVHLQHDVRHAAAAQIERERHVDLVQTGKVGLRTGVEAGTLMPLMVTSTLSSELRFRIPVP